MCAHTISAEAVDNRDQPSLPGISDGAAVYP